MKQQRKTYSHKKPKMKSKSTDVEMDWEKELYSDKSLNNTNEDDNEKTYKWYEEFSSQVERKRELTTDELVVLKQEASQVLTNETTFFHTSKSKRKSGADEGWIKTVLQKGTSSDKVAAHILKIQESPVFNLTSLTSLINMIKLSKKDFSFVADSLAELFITDLLPPNLKLRPFEKQPLDQLSELSSGNAMTRRRRLAFWAFEDELKKLYSQLIHALNGIARSSVDANKEKAITILYKLLASHPEQEDVILSMLVNKLGDPCRKVVSKVIYSLTQLLRIHEGMKQVIMDEVERLLFRPNVSVKTQYYAICLLSQFHFTINDDQVACNIISIYFAFFKACVKKGDVNSRMLSSLLMGLYRAYPYAKNKLKSLSDHINTLYKLVHLAKYNISLQCLRVLFQISDSSDERFYSALYKKLTDLTLATSNHQAMFLNLLFKALSKDNDIGRVITFIKRIFQLCALMPVPLACGLLYLVSQLIHKRKVLSSNVLRKDPLLDKYEDDEEEHYIDADRFIIEEKIEVKNNHLKDDVENSNGSLILNKDESINEEEDDKKNDIKERKPCASWNHSVFQKKRNGFNPMVRNPAFAEGHLADYTELTLLTRHFHPTVSLFANNILEGKVIVYTGDPLIDFTLVRFIERFVFKNPKKVIPGAEAKGPDPVLASRKYYTPSGAKLLPTNSRLYMEQNEKDVPADELFLYRYLKHRQQLGYNVSKKEKNDDDDDFSDVESVASEEFEELLDNMMSKKGKIDFADDIGDNLKKKKKKKSKTDEDDDIDDDDNDIDADIDGEEDGDGELDNEHDDSDFDLDDASDIDLDGIDDDDAEVMDFDDSEEDIEESSKGKKSKNKNDLKKKIKDNIASLFAPAEEFAEMLEEAGSSGYKSGTANEMFNVDNAAPKQLKWEMKRNDFWKKGKKRKFKNNPKFGKKKKQK